MSSKPSNNSSLHRTLMDSSSTCTVFFPSDIIFEILTWLPAKQLAQFKCVAKFFCSVIAEPLFVKVHHDRSSARPDGTQILISISDSSFHKRHRFYTVNDTGEDKALLQVHYLEARHFKNLNAYGQRNATNGLICVFDQQEDVVICNPTTRQHISLQRDVVSRGQTGTSYILGFDPISKSYKVLKLQDFWGSNEYKRQYCVLTLGVDKSWREINNDLLGYPDASVHIGGIIYLISSIFRKEIVTFNVGDENIGLVPFPGVELKKCNISNFWRLSWMEIDGRLAVVHIKRNNFVVGREMRILTLEKSMKWEKQVISLPWEESLITKDSMDIFSTSTNLGEILLLLDAKGSVEVLLYSFRKHVWRKIEVYGPDDYIYHHMRSSKNVVDVIEENLYFFSHND
ncbi:unnamed protein product [Cuscuta epithymum]|uniref:F-box domain-containing protein n=1 Tax=Cuscuta epithymum TaxID=186058 RepID=A0AAV0FAA7_9ASTE|nr:unnamed protein product [Cuscuta epithymum]CAH9132475.1 unnamed protein product [Cuscuta epithymum]